MFEQIKKRLARHRRCNELRRQLAAVRDKWEYDLILPLREQRQAVRATVALCKVYPRPEHVELSLITLRDYARNKTDRVRDLRRTFDEERRRITSELLVVNNGKFPLAMRIERWLAVKNNIVGLKDEIRQGNMSGTIPRHSKEEGVLYDEIARLRQISFWGKDLGYDYMVSTERMGQADN